METGLEFLARMRRQPSSTVESQSINSALFPSGIPSDGTIEIIENGPNGKTLLLMQLIANFILPEVHIDSTVGRMGMNVVLINTDHQLIVQKLRDSMRQTLKEVNKSDSYVALVDEAVDNALKKLIILNCYSNQQLILTLQTLDTVILSQQKIGLIAIDTISAYYWENRDNGGTWSSDECIGNLLRILHKHTRLFKIPIIYTKVISRNFDAVELIDEPSFGTITHRIRLIETNDTENFKCLFETRLSRREMCYKIRNNWIEWDHEY